MAYRIESVKLERFRAFRGLSVDGLGRVNLITGKNNTGKSSLLEGLRVVETDAAIETLRDMLRYREEYSSTPDDGSSQQLLVSNLFHGFPDLSAKIEPLILSANGKDYDTSVSVYVNWLSREPDIEGNLRFVEHSPLRTRWPSRLANALKYADVGSKILLVEGPTDEHVLKHETCSSKLGTRECLTSLRRMELFSTLLPKRCYPEQASGSCRTTR